MIDRRQLFRLGYSTISWSPAPDLERVFASIAEAGWEGVELLGVSADWLGPPRRVKRLLASCGLVAVGMFGRATLDGSAAEHLERQRRVIDYAAELEAGIYCMLGADRVWQRLPSDDELARLAEQAERLIDYAAPDGITVCYHAHPRCTVESEAEQDRLLAFTERLKICLDVSVSILMEEDPVAQLRKYRDRVGYVHVKDVGPGKFCLMGRGTRGLDIGACLAALQAIDYRGWVVGELSNYADTEATASCRENRQFLRALGY